MVRALQMVICWFFFPLREKRDSWIQCVESNPSSGYYCSVNGPFLHIQATILPCIFGQTKPAVYTLLRHLPRAMAMHPCKGCSLRLRQVLAQQSCTSLKGCTGQQNLCQWGERSDPRGKRSKVRHLEKAFRDCGEEMIMGWTVSTLQDSA